MRFAQDHDGWEIVLKNEKNILICDTDALTYKIWSEEVFKTIEPKTKQLIDSQLIFSNKNETIYLLCYHKTSLGNPTHFVKTQTTATDYSTFILKILNFIKKPILY